LENGAPATRIGFVPIILKSSIAFPEPRILRQTRNKPLSRKGVQACPAVNVLEKRVIEVLAPYSVQIRCVESEPGTFDFHLINQGTHIAADRFKDLFYVHEPHGWRTPKVPVVQISIPHFFVCDTVCYLNMLPAFASPDGVRAPGMLVSGRYPMHKWPRSINFAFEWSDKDVDFKMSRGQPLCYLLPETEDPAGQIELVPAKMTQALATYRARFEGVTQYTPNAESLFQEIEKYRPEKLLEEI